MFVAELAAKTIGLGYLQAVGRFSTGCGPSTGRFVLRDDGVAVAHLEAEQQSCLLRMLPTLRLK